MLLLLLLSSLSLTKKALSEQCFEIQDCSLVLSINKYDYQVVTGNWQDRSEICPLSDASVTHWVVSVQQSSDTLEGIYCSRGLELDPNIVCVMNNKQLVFRNLNSLFNQMGTFDIMFTATDINYSAAIPIDYAPTGVYSLYDDDTVYYYPGDDKVPLSWRIYHADPKPAVSGVFFEGTNVINTEGYTFGPETQICLATLSSDTTEVYTLLLINPTATSAGEYTLVAGTYSHVLTLALNPSYSEMPLVSATADFSSTGLVSPTNTAVTDESTSFTTSDLIAVVVSSLGFCLIVVLILAVVCVVVLRRRQRHKRDEEEADVAKGHLYKPQTSTPEPMTNGDGPTTKVLRNGHSQQNGNGTTTGEQQGDPPTVTTEVPCSNGHTMGPDTPNGVTPPPINATNEQSKPRSTETTNGQHMTTDMHLRYLKEISENTKQTSINTKRMANAAEQQRDIQLDLLDVNRNMSENMEIHNVAVSSDPPEEDTGFGDPPTPPSIPNNHPDTADTSQSSIHDRRQQSPPPLINVKDSSNPESLNHASSDADIVQKGPAGGGDHTSLEVEPPLTSASEPAIDTTIRRGQVGGQDSTEVETAVLTVSNRPVVPFLPDAVFDQKPENPEFYRLVGKHIISKWQNFGSMLGLEESDLSNLNDEADPEYRVTKVLNVWKRKSNKPFTWRNVIKALYDQGINNVAEDAIEALRSSAAQGSDPVN